MENKDPKYSAKKKREKKSKSASLLVANWNICIKDKKTMNWKTSPHTFSLLPGKQASLTKFVQI